MYTHILIKDNRFLIVESMYKPQRSGFALTTLKNIERVLEERLEYSSSFSNDKYSKFSEGELRAHLKTVALSIKDNFLNKGRSMSSIRRFFGFIDEKEEAIKEVTKHIDGLPSLHILPNALSLHLSRFLTIRDVGQLAVVNRNFKPIRAYTEVVVRAREFGYQERDLEGAKKYLKEQFAAVQVLVDKGMIPKEQVVRQGKKWFYWRDVDAEATLRNIKSNEEVFKADFTEKLKSYMDFINPQEKTDEKLIKALIMLGADLNVRNDHGGTTLMILCSNVNNTTEIVEFLISKGADIHLKQKGGYSALHYAAEKGKTQIVTTLLRHGAVVNDRTNSGATVLFYAKWDKELISLLLDHGADPNIAMNNGSLTLCAFHSNDSDVIVSENIDLLCQRGAIVNLQNGLGNTALHCAVLQGKRQTVEVLLKWGVDPSIANNQGKTALMYATDPVIQALLTSHESS